MQMNINKFIEVTTNLPANISVLVKGDTGIGKSDVVKQIGEMLDLPVLDWRLSTFSEGDILGLPELVDGTTRFAPNARFLSACHKPHLLFLDEGNRATNEVQQIAFQIVLDRELNGHKLHPETRIFMAINEGNDFDVNEMDPALTRRFWVTELSVGVKPWLSWADKNNIDPMIKKFIKKYPAHLMHEGQRTPGEVYPYPASWDRLNSSLAHAGLKPSSFAGKDTPDNAFYFCAGFVGSATTAAFLDYVRNYRLKIGADDILNNFEEVEADISELPSDKKNEAVDQVMLYLKEKEVNVNQALNIEKFMKHMSDEVVVDFMQNVLATKNKHNIKTIHKVLKTRVLEATRSAIGV